MRDNFKQLWMIWVGVASMYNRCKSFGIGIGVTTVTGMRSIVVGSGSGSIVSASSRTAAARH